MSINTEKAHEAASVNDDIDGAGCETTCTMSRESSDLEDKIGLINTPKDGVVDEVMHKECTGWDRLIHKQRASAATRGRENQCTCCHSVLRPDGVCHECGEDTSC